LVQSGKDSIYDEGIIRESVKRLGPGERISFGCACAELLVAACDKYLRGEGASKSEVLLVALDRCWSAATTPPRVDADIKRWKGELEELVGFYGETGHTLGSIAANAATAVFYLLDMITDDDDVGPCISAASQVYEAADTILQSAAPIHKYVKDIDQAEPVRSAVRAIYSLLDEVRRLPSDAVKRIAREHGAVLGNWI
jgi:hypothetical protein